ncbi:MAG TPA: sugar ABC transporter permease [Acetobacteraceae bacterium]|jgi:multiple sugar transport system permease protein
MRRKHLARGAGEVETRSGEGEGRNAQTDRALRPSPSPLRVSTSPTSWARCFSTWRDANDAALARVLLAPAFLLLALIVVYPVCRLVWTSFEALSLTSGLPAHFTGLDNYTSLATDPEFWTALTNTLLITLITVPAALLAGLALALIANLPFRIRWPVRLGLLVPWALPLAFVGLISGWFFQSDYGVVNDVLRHVMSTRIIWFNSAWLAFLAICLTITWKTSSFVALVLLAGLQTIPGELYEAASVDGANALHRFLNVTLPLLRPSIAVAVIFRTITSLQTFDIPVTMTRGGPGTSTVTLAMYIHQNTVDFLDLGYGSALAVVLFLVSMSVTALYLRQVRTP